MDKKQMWKRIIAEYVQGFSPGSLKKLIQEDSPNFWGYCTGIIMIGVLSFFDTKKGVVVFCLGAIPLLFCLISGCLHSFRLPKLFYLCPMEEGERREYIMARLLWNIFIPLIAGLLGIILLWRMDIADGLSALLLSANLVLIALILCGFNKTKMVRNEQGEKKRKGIFESLSVQEGCCLFISNLSTVFVLVIMENTSKAASKTRLDMGIKLFLLGLAVLVQLPLAMKMRKSWKNQLNSTFDYED